MCFGTKNHILLKLNIHPFYYIFSMNIYLTHRRLTWKLFPFCNKIIHCTTVIFREPLTLGHKLFQYLLFEPETQWNTSCPVLRRPQQFSQTLLLAVSSWQLHFHEFSQWLQYKGHKNFNFSFFLTTTSNFRKSLNKI